MAHLIDKAAVVAEIERLKERFIAFHHRDGNNWPLDNYGKMRAYNEVLSFLDTLEVREVNLEKEIDDYINGHFSECDDGVLISDANSKELTLLDITPLAKHFFELGLSSQLSWQDVKRLAEIGEAFMNSEESNNLSEEEYYTEILSKFKAQKG